MPKPSACPLCSVKTPWSCHPPITLESALFADPPKALPRPKGSSYTTVTTDRNGRSKSEMTFSGVGSVAFR